MARRGGVSTPILLCTLLGLVLIATSGLAQPPSEHVDSFPRALESYEEVGGIWSTLGARVTEEPFNLVATLIFLLAIVHTFLTSRFLAISHSWAHNHEERINRGEVSRDSVHQGAELMHFLGEVEVVFGLWAIALMIAIVAFYDWSTAVHYLGETVNFTEPAFVIVIMTLAATRPVLRLAAGIINGIAGMLGGSLSARWFTTLTVGPLLGSFITEPAAMTISALLLARTFYDLEPSSKLKYATLGLLLVNVSVGGTLTHFAAPPVLMVAAPWGWDMSHMLLNFGWKAAVGIAASNGLYFALFRRELMTLEERYAVVRLKEEIQTRFLTREDMDARFDELRQSTAADTGTRALIERQIQDVMDRVRTRLEEQLVPELRERGIDETLIRGAFSQRFEEIRLREIRRLVPGLLPIGERGMFVDPDWDNRDDPVPAWVTAVHVLFMGWTIMNAHHPPLFILGMLFFLGFAQVSKSYQNRIDLKPAMLVGFFLAGLVIHGGVQGWWIAPILGNLGETSLMAVATVLTAFNDNAAITYLATLVPGFSDALKHAVVAGAVAGGGLTIIANAPNPAGISLLKKYFDNGVSPTGLLGAAIVPTLIVFLLFLLTR
jgi:hypothetical protein